MNTESIWWERIPNSIAFISEITQSLIAEKSIVLQYSAELPWYSYLVQTVKTAVKQKNSSKSFEVICNADDPGAYLLKHYCKPEKIASYRPAKTYARFFAESDDIVIHERYFWIHPSSEKELDAWTTFVSDYVKARDKDSQKAVFIMEWQGDRTLKAKKGIQNVNFDNFISEYDRILFAMLGASSIQESSFIKTYFSELLSEIVGNDIELCALCLEDYKAFLRDPYDKIQKIIAEDTRSNYEAFSFCKTPEDVKHNIWEAQIKTIYPYLEEYREKFVSNHRQSIRKVLPITSSAGEQYTDPQDVELGTLVYMAGSSKLVLKQSEYDKLVLFRDARNCLSHLNILSPDQIRQLIG